MKAYQIENHGGAEVLRIVELPDPQLKAGQVPVRVTHVGLNHLDVWIFDFLGLDFIYKGLFGFWGFLEKSFWGCLDV